MESNYGERIAVLEHEVKKLEQAFSEYKKEHAEIHRGIDENMKAQGESQNALSAKIDITNTMLAGFKAQYEDDREQRQKAGEAKFQWWNAILGLGMLTVAILQIISMSPK